MLTIRAMLAGDLPAVLDIQSRCYGGDLPETAGSLLAKLTAAPDSCFVAEQDGRVRAYLFSLPWRLGSLPAHDAPACLLPPAPDCFYLHDLAVHPEARGSGASAALVARFLERAEPLGQACLVAVQDSAAWWARHGFAVVDEPALRPASLDSYGDAARYMRRLFS